MTSSCRSAASWRRCSRCRPAGEPFGGRLRSDAHQGRTLLFLAQACRPARGHAARPLVSPSPMTTFATEVAGALAAWSYPAVDCTTVSLSLTPGFADERDRRLRRPQPNHHANGGLGAAIPDACTRPYEHVAGRAHDRVLTQPSRRPRRRRDRRGGHRGERRRCGSGRCIPDDRRFRTTEESYDLRSALTHEVGHFIGLAHDCVQAGEAPASRRRGQPVPRLLQHS